MLQDTSKIVYWGVWEAAASFLASAAALSYKMLPSKKKVRKIRIILYLELLSHPHNVPCARKNIDGTENNKAKEERDCGFESEVR